MSWFTARLSRPQRSSIVIALLLVFTLQLVYVAHLYSVNWDEAHHLYDGYTIWTKHDYRLNPEVPPLVKLTAALPILPMRHLYAPPNQGRSEPKEAFLDGRDFVFSNGGDRLILPARLACMSFTLLLAWLVYIAGSSMFGTLTGLIALALFVFDPNVLAHGTLISTDIGSACFLFATVFAFYRYTQRPSAARLGLTALLAGLALVAKFTGILIVPMLLLLAAAEALRTRSLRLFGKLIAACAVIFLGGWVVLWAFYGFRYAPAPHGLDLTPRLVPYLHSMPADAQKYAAVLALIGRLHLLPEAFLWGLANTKITEWDYTGYFFGHLYRHGPWLYFPVGFLIKSTLPLLILLGLAPILWRRTRLGHARELTFLLLPVLVYFTVVTTSHFDIGMRHLMPIYPFLYLIAAATAAAALQSGPLWTTVAAVLVLWQPITSLRVAPAYMAYGNEAWGGPLNVRRYLSDANVDWGQQLKTVRRYIAAHHITHCWFAYFPDGAVQPADYGIPCRRLPTQSSLWWFKLPMNVPPVIDGTVFLSESDLDGVESGDGLLNPYDAFHHQHPVAILQDGVYVYQGRFAVPLASALVDNRRVNELDQAGQSQAALQLAQQATQLAPDSVITQLTFAQTLAAHGRWNEALQHFQVADHLVHTIRPDLQLEQFGPTIQKGLQQAEAHVPATAPGDPSRN